MATSVLPQYEVVAGAISREARYLLGKRPVKDGQRGGSWEFPGGKVKSGETRREALARELREELDIDVEVGEKIASLTHDYPDRRVTLHLYACELLGERPCPRYHSELGWFSKAELERLELCSADRGLVHHL